MQSQFVVNVDGSSASTVLRIGMILLNASGWRNGLRSVMMTVKPPIGLQQIPRNAQNVTWPLKRTVDVITWFVATRIVKQNSVGSALVPGSRMDQLGITAIVIMKMMQRRQGMPRSVHERLSSDTSSTATATWITCKVCDLSTSSMLKSSRRWKRCNNTTCLGLRCNSWRKLWMSSASAAPH